MSRRTVGAAGDEPPWELLDRYFSGAATPEECARVAAWTAAAPGRLAELEAVHALWAGGATELAGRAWDTDRAVAALLDQVHAHTARAREAGQSDSSGRAAQRDPRAEYGSGEGAAPSSWRVESLGRRTHVWPAGRWSVGATLAAAVGTLAVGWLAAWRALAPSNQQLIREFDTPAGTTATVSLRDGTVLTLGPATRLRVPADFGRRTRSVELDGEGLFRVVHDARRPFIVRTARTDVRDVGTTFTVVAYAKDPGMEVAVADGQVSVAGAALGAQDIGTIAPTGHITVRHRADVRPYLAWSQGSLVFVDTPLREVVHVLDRTYDLQITLADSTLGRQLITATFTNQPANTVLDDIAAIIGAAYERSARSVVIHRRPRPPGGVGSAPAARVASATLSHER